MARVKPLPSLMNDLEMAINRNNYPNSEIEINNQHIKRRSILSSSNPTSDDLPIDCILVYDRLNSDEETELESNHNELNKKHKKPSDRRKKFEEYLKTKQHLILERVESKSKKNGFVKIHAPFEVLLLTAEKIRMRLPIEKVEENDDNLSRIPITRSTWNRFLKWLKQPFYLSASLEQNHPDYYRAIYSSSIENFKYLFDTLRGSKASYFTPTERSLLTYELLIRAHFDYENDEQQNSISIIPIPNLSTEDTRKNSKRPGIDRLIAKKVYLCYFPLHEPLRCDVQNLDDNELNDREKLKKYWATMRRCFKFQPLSLIRSYMGEKVTFYFALSGFYNQMLIPPALIGLIIFIYGISSVFSDQATSDICGSYGQNTLMCPRCDKTCEYWKLSDSCIYSKISYVFDNAATLVFAILMSLWARWFVEFWKRHQSVLQYEWDSIDFEEHLETIRPEFESKVKHTGEKRINPVTGIEEPYVPTRKRIPFFLIAIAVVFFMVAIVCVSLFATIAYRTHMSFILTKNSTVKSQATIIITVTSAIMNLFCSIILSQFYYWIARKLTDLELHKYQSKYDDSLTIKIYLFQFFNFYSSLFYIAFFKGRFIQYPSNYGDSDSKNFTEQCDPAGCLVELSIQLVIIMIGKQLINNLFEFLNAMRRSITRTCFKRGEIDVQEQWEKDNQLYNFNSNTLIDEYLELVIQFGFITLFVTAFPLAPLFALINNLIELRLDAWKFLSKYKRPIPFKASDIGIWNDIISGISYLAVVTNAVVISWTSEFIPKMAYRTIHGNGENLEGYVNWTLSSFSISDYNRTNTMPEQQPLWNVSVCRYRDFREDSQPYTETSTYWNITAARLAFIIVFEHVIFFIIYIMQWLVPDVPKRIEDKIKHERYIDQRERWTSKKSEDAFKNAIIASDALSKLLQRANEDTNLSVDNNRFTSNESRSGKKISFHGMNTNNQ